MRFSLNETSLLVSHLLIGNFEENKRTVKRANYEKIKISTSVFSSSASIHWDWCISQRWISNLSTICSFLSLSRISTEDDERRCIGRGVNVVFFFFSLFLAAANVVLPSMCYFLLTVGWRSFFFVDYRPSALTSGRERREGEKRREKEGDVRHVIVLSSPFSANGRRRKKWVDGEWTSFPFLFLFYLKVSSNTLPLSKTKERRFATSLFTPPILFNDQRQAIMSTI